MKKLPIWDILTGIILLGIVCIACGYVTIFLNPSTAFNPLQPAPSYTPVIIIMPSPTSANPVVLVHTLPATWTPTPLGGDVSLKPSQTLRPSSTPFATETVYIGPTRTPLPTDTPTITATSPYAKCYIVSEDPVDNTVFSPGNEFDKRWTVKNNSGSTWSAANSDIHYKSGTKLQTGSDAYDLQQDVPDKGTVDITIHMRAPSSTNTYTSSWAITDYNKDLCSFFVKIIVK